MPEVFSGTDLPRAHDQLDKHEAWLAAELQVGRCFPLQVIAACMAPDAGAAQAHRVCRLAVAPAYLNGFEVTGRSNATTAHTIGMTGVMQQQREWYQQLHTAEAVLQADAEAAACQKADAADQKQVNGPSDRHGPHGGNTFW
jgi:hypothetical protein